MERITGSNRRYREPKEIIWKIRFFFLFVFAFKYITYVYSLFSRQSYSLPVFPPANIITHLHSLHRNQITVEGDNQECNYLELKFIAGLQAKRVAQEYTLDFPTYTHHCNWDRNDIRNVKNVCCGGWRGRWVETPSRFLLLNVISALDLIIFPEVINCHPS